MNDRSLSDDMRAIYTSAVQQWIHAEQMRWTILYNVLVGNTILLVAWATLYTALVSRPDSLGLRIVLVGSCAVGAAGSVAWAFWNIAPTDSPGCTGALR
jgi:hypothetical protein